MACLEYNIVGPRTHSVHRITKITTRRSLMNYPGNCATPKETARWMSSVAESEFGLPGILPVMTSCVELTAAWTSEGCVDDIPGYNYAVDHASLGWFQQQPPWWGTPEQILDPEASLRSFCREASKYKDWGWNTKSADALGQWCAIVQNPREDLRGMYATKGHPIAKQLLEESSNDMAVTAQAIVASAKKLLGAPYRVWYPGMSIPTWLDDRRGDPPPVSHLLSVGVECADLVCFAQRDNGLASGGGTEAFAEVLVNQQPFDPSIPGEPGAIAYKPYSGPALADQGHIAIYVDEHTLVQALFRDGVNDFYTDAETYSWGGGTEFTIYGYLPGVDYGDGTEEPPVEEDEATWRTYGWWQYKSSTSWDLKYMPPPGE